MKRDTLSRNGYHWAIRPKGFGGIALHARYTTIRLHKPDIIVLIDREKNFNNITTILVVRIKGYLEIEYELNIKKETIKRIEL